MKRNLLTLGPLSLALAACGGGENGIDGKDGKDGGSCMVADNSDGSATITCQDGTSFTVKNGENGQSCKLVENADGSAAVVCPYDGSSFIVRGNPDNYANYCAPSFYGKNCENVCDCQEFEKCNDGINGDGSCSCKNDLMTGEKCDQCDLTKAYGSNCTPYGSVTDKEGNTYKTAIINNQEWMAENLKATKDINGNAIKCYANTDADTDFVENYGCLYVWKELATLDGKTNEENTNRICPKGWRLPKKDDFDNLLTYVKDNKNSESTSVFLALIANSTSWTNYRNKEGVDEFGFGAQPAGYSLSRNYDDFGIYGDFWSSSKGDNDSYAYNLGLGNGSAYVYSNYTTYAFSVRCIKDSN